METRSRPGTKPEEARQVKRVGMVIGINPDQIEAYKELHAGPGVRDLLSKANIRNFSIFLQKLDDDRFYEFAYFEYFGADYESDMAWLDAQPENKRWLAMCDPMQIPLSGETGWKHMPSIYFNA